MEAPRLGLAGVAATSVRGRVAGVGVASPPRPIGGLGRPDVGVGRPNVAPRVVPVDVLPAPLMVATVRADMGGRRAGRVVETSTRLPDAEVRGRAGRRETPTVTGVPTGHGRPEAARPAMVDGRPSSQVAAFRPETAWDTVVGPAAKTGTEDVTRPVAVKIDVLRRQGGKAPLVGDHVDPQVQVARPATEMVAEEVVRGLLLGATVARLGAVLAGADASGLVGRPLLLPVRRPDVVPIRPPVPSVEATSPMRPRHGVLAVGVRPVVLLGRTVVRGATAVPEIVAVADAADGLVLPLREGPTDVRLADVPEADVAFPILGPP